MITGWERRGDTKEGSERVTAIISPSVSSTAC